MNTRNIIIVLAIFYTIVISATVIFLLSVDGEKKHELEIIMEKTVYKKGEIVKYIVKNTGDFDEWFSGNPTRTVIGDNVQLECCFVESPFTMYPGNTYHETFSTDSNIIKPGEYMIVVKGATMNFTITE